MKYLIFSFLMQLIFILNCNLAGAQQLSGNCIIVVLGSSTAEGAGASVKDSSWVGRFSYYLKDKSKYDVINLARGGYTTFQIIPDSTPIAPELNMKVDSMRNITRALAFHPDIIIINMPSNDAARGISADAQMKNYEMLYSICKAENIEAWICTPQPRNFQELQKIEISKVMLSRIKDRFGEKVIDFWSEISSSDGTILPQFNSGDGIHLNNVGHRILFEKVIRKFVIAPKCNKN